MDGNPLVLIGSLVLVSWPYILIAAFVVALFVGGPLLGCVVFAIVGAAGTRVSPSEETRDVDVAAFFEEQAAVTQTPGRNDSI